VSYALLSGVCRDFVFNTVNIIRGGRSRNCHSIAGRSNLFSSTAKRTHIYWISASFICSVYCWLFLQSYNELVVKLPNHLSSNTELKNEWSCRPTYILSNVLMVCTATTLRRQPHLVTGSCTVIISTSTKTFMSTDPISYTEDLISENHFALHTLH